MGTDIHPAVEVRRKGVWTYHQPKTLCPYYYEYDYDRTTGQRTTRLDANGEPVRSTWDRCKTRLPEVFWRRNYRVFAILGDVRNGNGFAGVYTHDWIPPISSNRGWPDDMTHRAQIRMSMEHSETWVNLAELKAYDYDQNFIEGGVLDEQEYLRCATTGSLPESWSGGIFGGKDSATLDTEQYASLYDSPISLILGDDLERHRTKLYDPTKRYFINHRWTRNLRGEVAEIPDLMIPYLEKLVPKGGTDEDVRIVMDFDS